MGLWTTSTPVPSCMEGGRHNFESKLLKSTAPSPDQINAADVRSWLVGDACAEVIESLTSKEFAVCCTWCGKRVE